MFNHVQLYRFEYSTGFFIATFFGAIPSFLGLSKFFANLGEDIVSEKNLVITEILNCFKYSSKKVKSDVNIRYLFKNIKF